MLYKFSCYNFARLLLLLRTLLYEFLISLRIGLNRLLKFNRYSPFNGLLMRLRNGLILNLVSPRRSRLSPLY